MNARTVVRPDGSHALAMSGLGTFAEAMTVHEDSVVPVRTEVPDEFLALIGCAVTTGVGAALWTARVYPGASVAVFGCGGVGQSVVQGARIAGAGRIFAVDPVDLKRRIAAGFGATDCIDPAAYDAVEQIRSATGGRGADYAFEVIGSPDVLVQAFTAVRKRGTVVAVGMPAAGATVTLPAGPLFMQEKRILGCFYGSASPVVHFPLLVDLVETGRLDLAPMVSRHIALDTIDDAFHAMENGEVIRSVIVPSAGVE
jgi:S-(hydroxymethyl)glutathione dehydrogenase/alcohol dehydrogenase